MTRQSALTAPFPPGALAGCVVRFNGQQLRIPASAYTLAGFRAWAHSANFPARGRASFLNQELLVDMSPEEITTHALVKSAVSNAIYNLNQKDERGIVLPDRVLLTHETAGLSTEPDCTFISWERLESGVARLVSQGQDPDRLSEVQGAPDWVLEVVSDSSVHKDTVLLPEVYYRAGVLEYWLIDARGTKISMRILRHGPDGFVPAAVQKGWQRSDVFARSFRLERRQGRHHLWQYTLHAKASRPRGG